MIRPRLLRELAVEAPPGGGRGYIAAASGLVRVGEFLYVVADDERELGVFPVAGDCPGRFARLLAGDLPAAPDRRKSQKPDFEALTLLPSDARWPDGALLALESGSRSNRRTGILWDLDERGALHGEPRRLDLAPLYEHLCGRVPDLNIEGATVSRERLLLFQRGNGRAGVNAVIALDLSVLMTDRTRMAIDADAVTDIRSYELGEVEGVRLCFSDAAALPDGRLVFTAVAEAGEDTYRDGECVASGVGLLSPSGEVAQWERFEPALKTEGVEATLVEGGIELLLVTDADDPDSPSPLFSARLDLRDG